MIIMIWSHSNKGSTMSQTSPTWSPSSSPSSPPSSPPESSAKRHSPKCGKHSPRRSYRAFPARFFISLHTLMLEVMFFDCNILQPKPFEIQYGRKHTCYKKLLLWFWSNVFKDWAPKRAAGVLEGSWHILLEVFPINPWILSMVGSSPKMNKWYTCLWGILCFLTMHAQDPPLRLSWPWHPQDQRVALATAPVLERCPLTT